MPITGSYNEILVKVYLEAMKEARTLEDVAQVAEMPLYRVRCVIRELLDAVLAEEKDGMYSITAQGLGKLV